MKAELLHSKKMVWVKYIAPAGQQLRVPSVPTCLIPALPVSNQPVHAKHRPFFAVFILQIHLLSSYLLSLCW